MSLIASLLTFFSLSRISWLALCNNCERYCWRISSGNAVVICTSSSQLFCFTVVLWCLRRVKSSYKIQNKFYFEKFNFKFHLLLLQFEKSCNSILYTFCLVAPSTSLNSTITTILFRIQEALRFS